MNTTNNNGNGPTLSIYHPNGRGTGSAVQFALTPATADSEGYVSMVITPQGSVASRGEGGVAYPTFDNGRACAARLYFADICAVLQVLRGECESIDEGRGLAHVSARASTSVTVSHRLEPVAGYRFSVHVAPRGDFAELRDAEITLSPAEALGLSYCLQFALGRVVFGG